MGVVIYAEDRFKPKPKPPKPSKPNKEGGLSKLKALQEQRARDGY